LLNKIDSIKVKNRRGHYFHNCYATTLQPYLGYPLILLIPASNVNTPAKVKLTAASGEEKTQRCCFVSAREEGRKTSMLENQEYNGTAAAEAEEAPPSPSEKLEENRPLGSLVPGAENRESTEIKKEIKPNTE
jgi:hypothetical protein